MCGVWPLVPHGAMLFQLSACIELALFKANAFALIRVCFYNHDYSSELVAIL